jgi:ABC-2 type transport system ATP-binding protein
MSARAAIAYLARLKGTPAGKAFKRADALLAEHGLGKVKRKKVKTLSKGMAQKVQVLGAIAHEPELIIFDEPFSGLDPVNQRVLEETIRAQASAGHTILFSTHVMEHAERLCDRILLIAEGRKAFEGTVRDALALAPSLAVLETDGDYDIRPVLAPLGFQWTEELGEHGNRRWRVRLENGHGSRQLLQACVEAGAPLSLFEPARASLHEAFVALVGDKIAVSAE